MSWKNRLPRVSAVAAAAATGLAGTAGVAQAEDVFGVTAEAGAFKRVGNVETPFTQAGGVPDVLRIKIDFAKRTEPGTSGVVGSQVGMMRDVETELPAGLQGNPLAATRCVFNFNADLGMSGCPRTAIVGAAVLRFNIGNAAGEYPFTSTVYNVMPPEGVVARFAFNALAINVYIDVKVNDDGRYTIQSTVKDSAQALTVHGVDLALFGVPAKLNGAGGPFPDETGIGLGSPGPGERIPLLTMGNDCDAPQRFNVRARSWAEPDRWASSSYEMPRLTGCDSVPLKADLEMAPDTDRAATPSGFTTVLTVPQTDNIEAVQNGLLKKVEVKLPEGVAVNPASAQGLVGCTDAQARTRELGDPTCPDASKIGTIKIDTPVLPGPMEGFVFVGEPKSQVAANGDMFRVFFAAKGHGVTIKQEGRITPDPVTGQLTAVFDEVPQQPFSKMTLKFNGGPRAPLATPTQCGEHTTTATITGATGKQITSQSTFSIACRDGLFGFAPTFSAGVDNILAGASSPFRISMGRGDGQRALSGVNLKLPKGLLANIKGNIGQVVGGVRAYSGVGSEPFGLPGTVTLEGPYGDAPFSLKVVVPAKAGPYDLGDVVVRQKVYIDPVTAQVTTVSDPLPTILQGVPIQLQRLDLTIDKSGFMRNPTSCGAQSIDAGLTSDAGQVASAASRFAVGGCRALALEPKMSLAWTDKTQMKKGKHPGVRATVEMPTGDANLRNVKVMLPLTAALDPDNAKALCEPAAAAARNCPEASIVGSASATTPALDEPVSGPVYFVKGTRTTKEGRVIPTLPKLYLKLSGQGVTIDLRADSSVTGPAGKQKLVTTFTNVPDVPVDAFRLQINSGVNGILKATNDVCGADKTTSAVYTGQNGRVTRRSLKFTAPDCKPQIVSTSGSTSKLAVRVGGIKAGRVTLSGSRIRTVRRTILASDAATVSARPKLTAGQRALLKKGRTVRVAVKVSFKPTKGKAKTWKRKVAIHGVKRSAS